jgi:hypothetical protein
MIDVFAHQDFAHLMENGVAIGVITDLAVHCGKLVGRTAARAAHISVMVGQNFLEKRRSMVHTFKWDKPPLSMVFGLKMV